MAKKKKQIEFPFYSYLKLFHDMKRKKIYSSYKPLTRKFLHFNSPENPTAWLRPPQFEALEMYVFLKEFLENKHLHQVFEEWYNKTNSFEGRPVIGVDKQGQFELFGSSEIEEYGISEFHDENKVTFSEIFKQIEAFKQIYPNYIFALTMGLGKTILMATSIFYEFLLANKYPKTKRYCHNALVFAPDKTVLHSLKEIETFDKSKVIPTEYVNWLNTNVRFHFLDDTGISLNAVDNSRYNIIISNTQKIILKKQHKDKGVVPKLFETRTEIIKPKNAFEQLQNIEINTEDQLVSNQRFAKLTRLRQLGIYVDEAHHIFGNKLAKDFSVKKSDKTSLRITINELAEALKDAGSRVVGCYNYTGTPYVGSTLLPEVVYAYGLKDAINNKYLKKVRLHEFKNIKNQNKAFIKTAITEFWEEHNGKKYEGLLPKFAFFASNINELQNELRPLVEEVLAELNIPTSKILVNVGDNKITSNDDLREFKNLDSPSSEKQFILLVNKGKEGWNCRSLFGVGLHREPKSKIFVLQATMRCLRAITDTQQTASVYLSSENINILENELQENFKLSIDDLKSAGDDKENVQVKLVPPPVKIKLKKISKLHDLREKEPKEGINLKLENIDTDKYKLLRNERSITNISEKKHKNQDISSIKEKREFSELTITAEISRYLNKSCLIINDVLSSTHEGIEEILQHVNENNEILYDYIIPRLFNEFYELSEYTKIEAQEIELVKEPKDKDFYTISCKKELIANINDERYFNLKDKSFHVDNYCFDSHPESSMFWNLINKDDIEKVWFTGMLTHGQSDFLIRYIDPESHSVRSYYPDFLVKFRTDDNTDSYAIIEVKGDNKIDDEVVKAKAIYATQIATSSGMTYHMIKGSDAENGITI